MVDIRNKVKLLQLYLKLPFYFYLVLLCIEVLHSSFVFINRKMKEAKKELRTLKIDKSI